MVSEVRLWRQRTVKALREAKHMAFLWMMYDSKDVRTRIGEMHVRSLSDGDKSVWAAGALAWEERLVA